jgi:endonuclease YncB( thermonuclease family)
MVEIYGVDRYKRLLSTIFLDGKDINLAMLEAGLAEVYRGQESDNPYAPQYQAAEETARATRKGMWVQGGAYESPRASRKRGGSAKPEHLEGEGEQDARACTTGPYAP